MALFKSIVLASILALSSTVTANHGPYLPVYARAFSSGTGVPFPSGTGTGYSYGTGTGVVPYPTGGSPGNGGSGSGSGSPSLSESAATCPLPTTVTTTTQVYVTVTVPGASQAASTAALSPPYSIPGGGVGPIVGTGTGVASTGAAYPTGTGSLGKRMEMRGLEHKEKKRGHFWA